MYILLVIHSVMKRKNNLLVVSIRHDKCECNLISLLFFLIGKIQVITMDTLTSQIVKLIGKLIIFLTAYYVYVISVRFRYIQRPYKTLTLTCPYIYTPL